MKRFVLPVLVFASLLLTGCFKDDDTPIIIEEITIINENGGNGGDDCPTVDVTGSIAANTTWTNDNIYVLNQKVVVDTGVILTIEAGTIIKGTPGTGSLASAFPIGPGPGGGYWSGGTNGPQSPCIAAVWQ